MSCRIAVAGAGIYGTTAAIKLAERGYDVTIFDPLGIMRAASAINQYRVHNGYHYPRSYETIAEVQEARKEFLETFSPAIVHGTRHYYAIPKDGSLTSVSEYEKVMSYFDLPYHQTTPDWINFDYIDRCWEVDENLYDPVILKDLVEHRMNAAGVQYIGKEFLDEMVPDWDFVVWATYGLHKTRQFIKNVKIQVAEKILIELPQPLKRVSLVVVDGPFTAFDPYGGSEFSLFGSAKLTNRWTSCDQFASIPANYSGRLNEPAFRSFEDTNYNEMVDECCLAVPMARAAKYVGSRFTLRVIEDNPAKDQRLLYVTRLDEKSIQIFSGKVVGAVKAANEVVKQIRGE